MILFFNAVIAFVLSAVCGGSSGFMLLPILGLSLPAANIPAALSLGLTVNSTSGIVAFGKHIRWRMVMWFVPFALPAAWLGAKMLVYINQPYLQIVIAILLLANISALFGKGVGIQTRQPYPAAVVVLVGVLSGLLSCLTGSAGMLFNRFYLRQGLTKEEVVATRAANELLLHALKLGFYISFGLLSVYAILMGTCIALGAILTAWLLKNLLPLVSDKVFSRTGYAAAVICGVLMLIAPVTTLLQGKSLTEPSTVQALAPERKFDANAALVIDHRLRQGVRTAH